MCEHRSQKLAPPLSSRTTRRREKPFFPVRKEKLSQMLEWSSRGSKKGFQNFSFLFLDCCSLKPIIPVWLLFFFFAIPRNARKKRRRKRKIKFECFEANKSQRSHDIPCFISDSIFSFNICISVNLFITLHIWLLEYASKSEKNWNCS